MKKNINIDGRVSPDDNVIADKNSDMTTVSASDTGPHTEKSAKCKKKTTIGGQALMEGLMMIGPEKIAMAVRKSDGQIHVETSPIGKSSKMSKIPFLRGSVKIFRQMVTGIGYLMKSAEIAEEGMNQEEGYDTPDSGIRMPVNNPEAGGSAGTGIELTEETIKNSSFGDTNAVLEKTEDAMLSVGENEFVKSADDKGDFVKSADNKDSFAESTGAKSEIEESEVEESEVEKSGEHSRDKIKKKKSEKRAEFLDRLFEKYTSLFLYMSVAFGLLLSVALFILLPNLISNLTLGFLIDKNANILNRIILSFFEGILRISIFIAYLAFASRLKDIKRVWMYHGAEHKTIACYEAGEELIVENIRKYSKHHPRCGTAFMFIVLLISIIVFSFIPKINIFVDLLIRLALVPLLASLSYEIIYFTGKHDNKFTRALSWPGLMLQRLTTAEPDDSMLEVAIAAMEPVIPADQKGDEW